MHCYAARLLLVRRNSVMTQPIGPVKRQSRRYDRYSDRLSGWVLRRWRISRKRARSDSGGGSKGDGGPKKSSWQFEAFGKFQGQPAECKDAEYEGYTANSTRSEERRVGKE